MKIKNMLFLIGSAMILLGFFMPFIDVILVKISGFDLLKVSLMGERRTEGDARVGSIIFFAILLMYPLAGLLGIWAGFKRKPLTVISYILAMLGLLGSLFAIFAFADNMRNSFFKPDYFALIGNGFYICILGVIVMTVGLFVILPKPTDEGNTQPTWHEPYPPINPPAEG